MKLLAPLGLLGLIGIIILIIIYIIKPNYQSKFVSSTFVWKLSLKYKKKKIPLSKLRNIILFICQVLILASAAFILAQPFLDEGAKIEGSDRVMIIDASASMNSHAEGDRLSRIERAVARATEDALAAIEEGDRVTLIWAADKATFLLQQAGAEQMDTVDTVFLDLSLDYAEMMTYSSPDIKGAMALAEQITAYAENSTVTLYTDTVYINPERVTVVDVKADAEWNKDAVSDTDIEWNAAVLDVRVTMVENYYRVEVDVACYGADAYLPVYVDIADANDTGVTIELETGAFCSGDEITTLVFAYLPEEATEAERDRVDEEIGLFAYDNIRVYIDEDDALDIDNSFYVYGGHKPVLKICYYSTLPNNYYTTALLVLQDIFKDDWSVEVDEFLNDPPSEGYDIYIYEHDAPAKVPNDGIVIYTNVGTLPNEAGIRFAQPIASPDGRELFLEEGEAFAHPLMKNITAENISITQLLPVASADGYSTLLSVQGIPAMMIREEKDSKIIVLPFSLHYSNLPLTIEFPLFLSNVISHYFPPTLEKYIYEVKDTVKVNARSELLEIDGPNLDLDLTDFPAEWIANLPGTYTLMQNPLSGELVIESIFVKIPASESNTHLTEGKLINPYFYSVTDSAAVDLLFYIALAAVALLFFEWWLKSREQI